VSRIDEAAAEALAGNLIVLPTDTVYGIGTRPDLPDATRKLFEAKERPRDLTLPVLVPSAEDAARVAEVDDRARHLMERFWPGPLTIVLRRTAPSREWDLGADRDTIGLRRPRHLLTLAVLERTGPLAVTSANLSDRPTPSACEELVALFGDRVSVYLCQQEPVAGAPSTVVDLAGDDARVLRRGAIPEDDVLAELGRAPSGGP